MRYGNGATSQRSFNSGLQLKSIAHGTSSNPSVFLDLEYHYDEGIANTGRIMQISDNNDPSRSLSYDYDDFGRLVAAETAGSHWGLAWNYDPYGSQLSQSLTKGTGPTRSVSVDANTNPINGFSDDTADFRPLKRPRSFHPGAGDADLVSELGRLAAAEAGFGRRGGSARAAE